MKSFLAQICILVLSILLVGCGSKVSQDNFSKIQDGMTEEQVHAILGKPTEVSSSSLLGISGTSSTWKGSDAEINILFMNGKVMQKQFSQTKGENK
jgi:hypothetical protein